MIALGNDIIDLNWEPQNRDKYFLRLKTYLLSYCETYLPQDDIRMNLLHLWAIKEAVYKSSVKMGNRERFNPKNIMIELMPLNGDVGIAKCNEGLIYFRSVISDSYISCISECTQNQRYINKIGSVVSISEHNHVSRKLIDELSKGGEVRKDDNQIPSLYLDGKLSSREISISHHGKFVSVVMEK